MKTISLKKKGITITAIIQCNLFKYYLLLCYATLNHHRNVALNTSKMTFCTHCIYTAKCTFIQFYFAKKEFWKKKTQNFTSCQCLKVRAHAIPANL